METNWTRWVVPLIIGVILVAVFIYWVWGQMQNLPIGYEGTSEEARFLRYLTCSYAMCAQPCNDPKVVVLPLEIENGMIKLGCYDKCKELAAKKGKSESEHLCGNDYSLNFTFNDDTIYRANDTFTRGPLGQPNKGIETDITRYKNYYWRNHISDSQCYDRWGQDLSYCKYDHAGLGGGDFPEGICEGVIEKAPANCRRLGSEGVVLEDIRTTGWGEADRNTGHLWVGSDIASTADCKLLGMNGNLENPLYGNCTFQKGQIIYIWTQADKYDECGFAGWGCYASHYCPELILCSTS